MHGNTDTRRSHSDAPERPEMQLESLGNNLDRLADRMFSSTRLLNELADRIYGPPPPSPIPDGVKAKAGAALNRISDEVDRCLQAQDSLEEAIGRFNGLA